MLLCFWLLSCCYAQGETAAMEELRAAWSVQGWNANLPYCQWPGILCAQNTTNVIQMYDVEISAGAVLIIGVTETWRGFHESGE